MRLNSFMQIRHHLALTCLALSAASAWSPSVASEGPRCASFEREATGFMLQFSRGIRSAQDFRAFLAPVLSSLERCRTSDQAKLISAARWQVYNRHAAALSLTSDLYFLGTRACERLAVARKSSASDSFDCSWRQFRLEQLQPEKSTFFQTASPDALVQMAGLQKVLAKPKINISANTLTGDISDLYLRANLSHF